MSLPGPDLCGLRSRAAWISRVGLGLFATLALCAAAPTPSPAAGWSAPVTVSSPHDAISNLGLASGHSGDMVFWHFDELEPPADQIFGPPGAGYAVAPPGGAFSLSHPLPASYAGGPLVALGGGALAQLILRRTSVNNARPSVAIGDVTGHFGSPLHVLGTVWAGKASLAGNLSGELLLAWISSTRPGHREVWASVRLPGHGFAPPQLISSSADGLSVTAGVGPGAHGSSTSTRAASDMVVAFDSKRGRMLVRVRPHGSGWGAVADIGPAAIGNDDEVATPYIGRSGRIAIAWYHRQLSEGGEAGPGYAQVAVRPPNRGAFLPVQTLAKSQSNLQSGELALVGGDGYPPLVAFVATDGNEPATAHSVVSVSLSRGDRFGPARRISLPGQWASGVAAAVGLGGPIVTWLGAPEPPSSTPSPGAAVYAALGAPGSNRLGGAVEVSPAEHVQSAVPLRTENGARWIVAWSGLPRFISPLDPGQSVVQVTSCAEGCR